MGISIVVVGMATDELAAALSRLLPQLTGQAAAFSVGDVERIVGQPGLTLLVAYDDADAARPILGTATVIVVEELTGSRARLESVVVDATARGRGVGEALTSEAIRLAAAQGADSLNLTTSPRRESANRLYQRLGFTRRETNVYVLPLGGAP